MKAPLGPPAHIWHASSPADDIQPLSRHTSGDPFPFNLCGCKAAEEGPEGGHVTIATQSTVASQECRACGGCTRFAQAGDVGTAAEGWLRVREHAARAVVPGVEALAAGLAGLGHQGHSGSLEASCCLDTAIPSLLAYHGQTLQPVIWLARGAASPAWQGSLHQYRHHWSHALQSRSLQTVGLLWQQLAWKPSGRPDRLQSQVTSFMCPP